MRFRPRHFLESAEVMPLSLAYRWMPPGLGHVVVYCFPKLLLLDLVKGIDKLNP